MLPSLFSFYENETMPVPFLDKLSRLEKLEVLTSEEDWLFFRELRNNLTHDYPESTEQTVRTLNILYDSWNKLVDLYLTVKKHAEKVIRKNK